MKTYASFFEGHDKGEKELGVVEELIVALNRGEALGLHSPKEFSPDPPDCVCLDASDRPVAIEVAEVVCRTTICLNAQGHSVYRNWRPGELRDEVGRVLTAKDGKTLHGGPYHAVIACLFTDEPALTLPQATAELDGRAFGPFKQLTNAYLLFSYDPGSRIYPLVRLGIQR